jgi:hypothetical protein
MNNTVFYIENNISDENFIRINDELKNQISLLIKMFLKEKES